MYLSAHPGDENNLPIVLYCFSDFLFPVVAAGFGASAFLALWVLFISGDGVVEPVVADAFFDLCLRCALCGAPATAGVVAGLFSFMAGAGWLLAGVAAVAAGLGAGAVACMAAGWAVAGFEVAAGLAGVAGLVAAVWAEADWATAKRVSSARLKTFRNFIVQNLNCVV
jgi:hypothetical protein